MGRDLALERGGIGTPAITRKDSKIHDARWKEPVKKEHTLHNYGICSREKSPRGQERAWRLTRAEDAREEDGSKIQFGRRRDRGP